MTSKSGFTITELLVGIAILLILSALLSTAWRTMGLKISQAKCMSNMRNLHVSLAGYVSDIGRWPQYPDLEEANEEHYEDWWIKELTPFGGVEEVWKCPVLKATRVADAGGYELRMHYIPADFDANPISPYRWPNMPWLIERGNNHGRGALVAFPDGSIRNSLVPNL